MENCEWIQNGKIAPSGRKMMIAKRNKWLAVGRMSRYEEEEIGCGTKHHWVMKTVSHYLHLKPAHRHWIWKVWIAFHRCRRGRTPPLVFKGGVAEEGLGKKGGESSCLKTREEEHLDEWKQKVIMESCLTEIMGTLTGENSCALHRQPGTQWGRGRKLRQQDVDSNISNIF